MRPLFLLFMALFFGCKKDDVRLSEEQVYPKLIEFDNFTINVPDDWAGYKLQGIDSKVGYITNHHDRLDFDYGWYSNDLRELSAEIYIREKTKIDGRDAVIIRPKNGDGQIGLYIIVNETDRFNMLGKSSDEQQIINIFRSVKFR